MVEPAFRLFDVSVRGREPVIFTAATRGKALYDAFLSYSDVYSCTFREFLSLTRVAVRSAPPTDDGYGYVRRAYGVDVAIGQRVQLRNEGPTFNGRRGTVIYPGPSTAHIHLVLDGETRLSLVHPFSFEPIEHNGMPEVQA